MTLLSFSEALQALKDGFRVQREGWNGRGQWLVHVPGSEITVAEGRPLAAALPAGTVVKYRGHIDIFTAQGELVPWMASQTDVLSTDWRALGTADKRTWGRAADDLFAKGSFSEAVELMRSGGRIRRAGWNGKGMWVAIVAPHPVVDYEMNQMAHSSDPILGTMMPFMVLKTVTPARSDKVAEREMFVPWNPAQTDLLGEDWEALDDQA